jgi:hypothetical protein
MLDFTFSVQCISPKDGNGSSPFQEISPKREPEGVYNSSLNHTRGNIGNRVTNTQELRLIKITFIF